MLGLAVSAGAVCYLLLSKASSIDDDVRQLEEATIPPEATLIESQPGRTDTWVVERSWTFETSGEWDDYRRWLATRLPTGFRTDSAATQPAYVRSLAGDSQHITFQNLTAGSRLRIRVTFVSDAD